MTNVDIIRAWKDEEYRLSLSEEQLATLPANPAGQIELAEADLEEVSGGLHKNKQEAAPADAGSQSAGSQGTSGGTTSKSTSAPSKPAASASVSAGKVSGGTTSKTTSAGSR